jgi:transcription antitermination factor NusG
MIPAAGDMVCIAPAGTPLPAGETAAAGQPAWFVVYTKPHKDWTAVLHLQRRHVEVFYPRLRLPGYADVRRQVVPLFPAYLFVRIELERQFPQVVWAPGVSRMIGSEGRPVAVDDAVIDAIKAHADEDGVIQARPRVTVGQHVEITRGPFAGIVGIIQRPPNARGRIRVLMRLLNRGVVGVELPLQHVKAEWTPLAAAPAAESPAARLGGART